MRADVSYVDAVPSRCADLLATDEADFGLVPVIEYQRIGGIKVVPGVCVASKQKVRSVLLVSKLNNLKKIRSVALDESSRTSATLTKIIFREFLAIEPAWATANADLKKMLRESDAALMIGDPALTFPRLGLNVWDLASLWHDFTGTGFVFAMWMAKSRVPKRFLSVDFASARDEGIRAIEEIITAYQDQVRLPSEELRDYLTNNVTFNLDQDLRSGMQLYFDLAARHELIDRPRTLEFLEMQHAGGDAPPVN